MTLSTPGGAGERQPVHDRAANGDAIHARANTLITSMSRRMPVSIGYFRPDAVGAALLGLSEGRSIRYDTLGRRLKAPTVLRVLRRDSNKMHETGRY